MTKTEGLSIAKAEKMGTIAGSVLGFLALTLVWTLTALALVSIGIWPFVAWFWCVMFWMRGVSKQVIRWAYIKESGRLPESWVSWREQAAETARLREERKAAAEALLNRI